MSKKNLNEIPFKDKFKDRIENMGKEGMASIMKNMDNITPINKNDFQGNIIEGKNIKKTIKIF
jgi:hypothetical protein